MRSERLFGFGSMLALLTIAGTAAAQPCEWSPLSTGIETRVHGLGVFNGDLIIGGAISTAGGASANNVVRWDGQAFHDFGGGTDGQVTVFETFQNDLYMGGSFTEASGNTVNYIARWDGQEFVSVAGGISYQFTPQVRAMAVYDGALHIGGLFTHAGGVLASFVAKWDGQSWDGLGPTWMQGTNERRGVTGGVSSMVVHDEGQGPVLFVAGGFTRAGDVDARGIARWDGQDWSAVGGSVTHTTGQYSPEALAVFNGDLYATGRFSEMGHALTSRIARWDGELWWDVAGGLQGSFTFYGDALAVFDDGRGEALYVGGQFDAAGGLPADRIARWDGQTWEALGDGVSGLVRAMQVWNGGLYVGGSFNEAGGQPAERIARWGCEQECYADCDDNGILNIDDFLCFINAFAQSDPYADCDDNGVFNIDDFLCFINEFAQGCP